MSKLALPRPIYFLTRAKLSSAQHPPTSEPQRPRLLVVPNICPSKWARARRQPHPGSDDSAHSPSSLIDLTNTDSNAQWRCPDVHDRDRPILTNPTPDRQRRNDANDRDLFTTPNMDLIDFSSEDGFLQCAGKKKKKATAYNWFDDDGDKKDPNGGEGGGDGNKDQNGGDSGAGDASGNAGDNGGDGGDKKDRDDKSGDANNDDIWDFAGGNKKNKKGKTTESFGLPEIASTDFHEIKLDDSGGGDPLDFGNFGAKAEKITSGLSSWTTGWGGSSWGWGGLKSPAPENPKETEEKPKSPDPVDENPWSINRAKPKKKTTTTFNFGSFGEIEDPKEETIDFLGNKKSNEKKDLGGFSWGVSTAKTTDDDFWGNLGNNKTSDDSAKGPEKPPEDAADDAWGWSSTKKEVGSAETPVEKISAQTNKRSCRRRKRRSTSSKKRQSPIQSQRLRWTATLVLLKVKRLRRRSRNVRKKPLRWPQKRPNFGSCRPRKI